MVFDANKFKELSDYVHNAPYEDGYDSLLNVNYQIQIVPQINEDGTANGIPAELYARNDAPWFIHIWEGLEEHIWKGLLFHEMGEQYFRVIEDMGKTEGHNAIIPHELEFLKERYGVENLLDYVSFCDKYEKDGIE